MEFLTEITPNLTRVAYVRGEVTYVSPDKWKFDGEILESTSTLGFTWQFFWIAIANDFDEIISPTSATETY
jgi:hypothetical protein